MLAILIDMPSHCHSLLVSYFLYKLNYVQSSLKQQQSYTATTRDFIS